MNEKPFEKIFKTIIMQKGIISPGSIHTDKSPFHAPRKGEREEKKLHFNLIKAHKDNVYSSGCFVSQKVPCLQHLCSGSVFKTLKEKKLSWGCPLIT